MQIFHSPDFGSTGTCIFAVPDPWHTMHTTGSVSRGVFYVELPKNANISFSGIQYFQPDFCFPWKAEVGTLLWRLSIPATVGYMTSNLAWNLVVDLETWVGIQSLPRWILKCNRGGLVVWGTKLACSVTLCVTVLLLWSGGGPKRSVVVVHCILMKTLSWTN